MPISRRALLKSCLLLPALPVVASAISQPNIAMFTTIDIFAFGGIGYSGQTSQGEEDFAHVIACPQEEALSTFIDLFVSGNAQAKCYALVGIKKLDPAKFAQLSQQVATSHDTVITMRGCIKMDEAMSTVVKQIAQGDFDSHAAHPRTS